MVQGFALRRVPFAPDQKGVGRAKSTRPEKRRAPKALGDRRPTPFWWGAQTPAAEGKKNLLSLKAANSHLWWSGVALVVFMIVWWLDRLPVISCSNSAAFLTAEQIFLKAWKARAFSFTPTYRGEPKALRTGQQHPTKNVGRCCQRPELPFNCTLHLLALYLQIFFNGKIAAQRSQKRAANQ